MRTGTACWVAVVATLTSCALVTGEARLGWFVMTGTAVAGAVLGAIAGAVWGEDSDRSYLLPGILAGVVGAILLVATPVPVPVLAAVVVTSAAVARRAAALRR